MSFSSVMLTLGVVRLPASVRWLPLDNFNVLPLIFNGRKHVCLSLKLVFLEGGTLFHVLVCSVVFEYESQTTQNRRWVSSLTKQSRHWAMPIYVYHQLEPNYWHLFILIISNVINTLTGGYVVPTSISLGLVLHVGVIKSINLIKHSSESINANGVAAST